MEELKAALRDFVDLVEKWGSDLSDYPLTGEGMAASATAQLCIKEVAAVVDKHIAVVRAE